jgi:protein-L-isoaspartate(D-aspartate) O-methyltransferase
MRSCSLFAVLLLLRTTPALGEEVPDFHAARSQMVYVIRIEALITSAVTGIREIDARVLTAMSKVPRHDFVAALLAPLGCEDTPLPVDVDQNLTEPCLAALMTPLLQVEPGDTVFETGTGLRIRG